MEVKRVPEHKHLGLILDSKLSFVSHINGKISRYLSVKTLDQIYKMYVRPHLDFCDVIYDIPKSRNHFDSSITLNYPAALAITGSWNGPSLKFNTSFPKLN